MSGIPVGTPGTSGEGVVQLDAYCWECFFPSRAGRVEFFDSHGNTMLILEPRPAEMRVNVNSCIGGVLGQPEWYYLPVNSSSYRVQIVLTHEGFSIVSGGVQDKLFHHRVAPSEFSGVVKYTPG